MKDSDDHSLFVCKGLEASPQTHSGLLATSPRHFAHARDFVPVPNRGSNAAYSMTNKGLSLDLLADFLVPEKNGHISSIVLDCSKKSLQNRPATIALKRVSFDQEQYVRVHSNSISTTDIAQPI
jgi:hypothetical protein